MYKPGQRVIIIGHWGYGIGAIIADPKTSIVKWNTSPNEVLLRADKPWDRLGDEKSFYTIGYKTDVISEEIFNSPLYQALGELCTKKVIK